MRVGVITADWLRDERGRRALAGSGWARVGQVAEGLRARGHDVEIGQAAGIRADGRLMPLDWSEWPLMRDPELVVVQRWMHAGSDELIRAARAAGQVVVQDVDDWYWGLDPRNRAHATTDPRRNAEVNREHYAAGISAADVVTVSTEFLARRVRERTGTRTRLLRNVVPHAFHPDLNPVRPVREGLRVGWAGWLGWRSGDLEVLAGVLPGFLADSGSTFTHLGAVGFDTDTAAERLGLPAEVVAEPRPAVPPAEYPRLLTGVDVGLVPLTDVPFNRAKSWIKGLEYAASGIPFVASRMPEYEALGCGLLAGSPAEWRAALDRLRDPEERQRQRDRGLAVAAEHALSRRVGEWESVYSEELTRARR